MLKDLERRDKQDGDAQLKSSVMSQLPYSELLEGIVRTSFSRHEETEPSVEVNQMKKQQNGM